MSSLFDIGHHRLANQHIARPAPGRPEDVVHALGMIQAQDYQGALWAVGLRLPGANQDDIEQAITERKFVRTWPARGTLHFVAVQDVRWMLALMASRNILHTAGRYRQLRLEQGDFDRSREVVACALQGGNQLPREALYQALVSAGVSTAGQRGIHILGRLAQEGLICFGPRAGKTHVFVLLEEWLPPAEVLPHDQALAELARRYFTSHGPATVQDFVWWSGLPVAEARTGLEMARSQLAQEEVDDQTCWLPRSAPGKHEPRHTAHLLPGFDEYLVGYRHRSAVLDPLYVLQANAGGGMLNPTIVIDGKVVGTWKRVLKRKSVAIMPAWFAPPDEGQMRAFNKAARHYAAFLGLEAE